MSLRNISVSTRASLSFAVMALIVLLVGGLSLLQMQRMNDNAERVEQEWLPSILALNDMSREFLRIRALTLRLFVNRDAQTMRSTEQSLGQVKDQLSEAQERYRKLISSQAEQAMFDRYLAAQNEYLREQSKFVELSRQDKLEEGRAVVNGELNNHANDAAQALLDMTELNKKGAATSIAEGRAVRPLLIRKRPDLGVMGERPSTWITRQRPKIDLQHIRFDHRQLRVLAQAHGQIAVQLDHRQMAQTLDQRLRECGQAGANLDHGLTGHRGNGVHDGIDDAAVCQKVLTKAFAGDVLHWTGSRIST